MIYIAFSVFFLFLFLYPYLVYPLILKALPKRDGYLDPMEDYVGTAALVFCAYNEERAMPSKIENIKRIKELMPGLRVVAYTDNCSDSTVELLKNESDLIELVEGVSRQGKATGMRKIVDALDEDVVIFTDANVLLEPSSAKRILDYFTDPSIGTVAGKLRYLSDEDTATASVGTLYWRMEENIKHLESLTGSMMGADGSIFAARRELYPYVPKNLLDDFVVSMSPLFKGYRVVSAPDVFATEKAATSSADEFSRKRRIACRAFKTSIYLYPHLMNMTLINKFKFVSHKLLRWLGAVSLLLSAFFFTAFLISFFGLFVALFIGVFCALTFVVAVVLKIPFILKFYEILLSVFATGLGVAEAVMGKDYTTWDPAKSRS